MQRTGPSTAETRPTRTSRARRGGLAAAALLVATTGLAATATVADAAPKKKPTVTVAKVAKLPKTVTAAAAFKVTTTVRNTSKKPAKASVVYRLSKDKKLDGKDTKLATAKTGTLRPKATKKIKPAVKVSKTLAEGTYYVLACLGSSCKAAKTYVLRSDVADQGPVRGTLSGTLTFTQPTSKTDWTTRSETATVNVAMSYSGPFDTSHDLVTTGSSYSWDINRAKSQGDEKCTTATTEIGSGGRALTATGNRYTDEIWGTIGMADFSEISVNLLLNYAPTRKVTTSGTSLSCTPGTTEEAVRELQIIGVKLKEVSRTATDITYQVTETHGSYSGSSGWGSVTGPLTLHLG